MKTKDLIAQLQKLVDDHEPHIEVMGDHEIVIDVFGKQEGHKFEYLGFSPDIRIEYSADGVYPILTAFASKKRQEGFSECLNCPNDTTRRISSGS